MSAAADDVQRVYRWARDRPFATDVALAIALAATAGTVSVLTVTADPPPSGYLLLTLAAFAVLHLAVSGRRRWPVSAFVLAAAGEAALAIVPLQSGGEGTAYPVTLLPAGLAYLICAYSVSARAPSPWPRMSLLVGMIGTAAVTVRFVTAPAFADTAPGGQWGGTLFVVAALLATVLSMWALGAFRRWRLAQIEGLAERARRAEQDRADQVRQAAVDERARIAREMHDVVAHSLSVMVRQAEGGRFVAATDTAKAAEVMRTIADTGREALQDMRSLLGVLRSDDPQEMSQPQPTIADITQMVDRVRESGLPVSLDVSGRSRNLDRAAHLAAYRLVQESLTNVVKHAGAGARAQVRIDWGEQDLTLEVTDTGQPPPPTVGSSLPGRGHVGMSERLTLLGGSLSAGPATDGGYRVTGRIPLVRSNSVAVSSTPQPTPKNQE